GIDSAGPVSTTRKPPGRPRAEPPRAALRPAHPAWLPALVLSGGWIAGWPASLLLGTSAWAGSPIASVSAALIGWVVLAPLVAADRLARSLPHAGRRVNPEPRLRDDECERGLPAPRRRRHPERDGRRRPDVPAAPSPARRSTGVTHLWRGHGTHVPRRLEGGP